MVEVRAEEDLALGAALAVFLAIATTCRFAI
jgi:hypothetical protein